MRELINGQMANYFLQHAKEGKWTKDGSAYVLPSMGYMGNQSLIADDEKGTNLRYGDWWDYQIDAPQARRFYTADRLSEPGKAPVYQSKYGLGRNKAAMTESTDNLLKAIWDGYKEDATATAGKYIDQAKTTAGNYVNQATNAARNYASKAKSYLSNALGIKFSQNGGKLIPRNTNN